MVMPLENFQGVSLKEKDATPAGARIRHPFITDLREIVTDLWQYRELLYQFILRDIRVRYKQAVIGFGWAIFMPALTVLAGSLVKYAMAHLAGKEVETGSIAGMTIKALPWSFFIGAVSFSTTSLTSNINLVTKIYFPREILPLSATFSQAFDTLIGAAILFIMLPFLSIKVTLTFLWFPVLGVLFFLITIATAFFFSCANLFFRDVKYIVQVLMTFGIFFTPVFFEPTMFGPLGSKIMMLNPLSPLLEGIRLSIVQGHNLFTYLFVENTRGQFLLLWSPWYLAYSACWAMGGLLVISCVFHRLQFVFAEYI
jgi:lipopolysaccharide transport system permease protein